MSFIFLYIKNYQHLIHNIIITHKLSNKIFQHFFPCFFSLYLFSNIGKVYPNKIIEGFLIISFVFFFIFLSVKLNILFQFIYYELIDDLRNKQK